MILGVKTHRFTRVRTAALVLLLTAVYAGLSSTEPTATALAENLPPGTAEIHGTDGSMTPRGVADPHMRMTPERPATPADVAHANQLAQQLRRAIEKYRDVHSAEKAGYRQFPPKAEGLKVVHYVNLWLSYLEAWRVDPEQPGSLLYERQPDGSLRLLGAMITAPAEATLEDLNKRVPISIARWHLHVNMCVPEPIWDEKQWARQRNGRPLFGPDSPIATENKCQSVGGKFLPTVFGWMVHANVFADNPADVWDHMHGHEHDDGGHGSHHSQRMKDTPRG